ncbi:putative ABC transported MDR-type, permease component [Lachnospiraceae bacterium TWA4]|nr:putative ABC transported MDR-type, permease component [Lachnospiraceae bacterium TWA4]
MLRYNWLTIRHSKLLVIIPVIVGFIVLFIGIYKINTKEVIENVVYIIQTLFPISGIFWSIAYLNVWIDSESEETLRACKNGQHICGIDLIILNGIYDIFLIVIFLIFQLCIENLWMEYLRVIEQQLFFTGCLYVISIIFHSTAVGSMMVMTYDLFCLFFVGNSVFKNFCLIQPNILVDDSNFSYILIGIASMVLYLIGIIIEKKFYLCT